MYDSLKNSPSLLNQLFHEKFQLFHSTNRQKRQVESIKEKATECQYKYKNYDTFQCILNSNIDKNFTKHNNSKFGDLSHNITVHLIWTKRSPHYQRLIVSKCAVDGVFGCNFHRSLECQFFFLNYVKEFLFFLLFQTVFESS